MRDAPAASLMTMLNLMLPGVASVAWMFMKALALMSAVKAVVVVDATNLGGSLSAAKQPVHMQSNSTQDLFIT